MKYFDLRIEIIHTASPSLSKGFFQSMEDLQPDHQYVILPSGSPYQIKANVKALNLLDFLSVELTGLV